MAEKELRQLDRMIGEYVRRGSKVEIKRKNVEKELEVLNLKFATLDSKVEAKSTSFEASKTQVQAMQKKVISLLYEVSVNQGVLVEFQGKLAQKTIVSKIKLASSEKVETGARARFDHSVWCALEQEGTEFLGTVVSENLPSVGHDDGNVPRAFYSPENGFEHKN